MVMRACPSLPFAIAAGQRHRSRGGAQPEPKRSNIRKKRLRTSSSLSSALLRAFFFFVSLCDAASAAGWTEEEADVTTVAAAAAALLAALLEELVGFVCMRTWRVSSSDREKRFSQLGKVHACGFSPVCVRMCRVCCALRETKMKRKRGGRGVTLLWGSFRVGLVSDQQYARSVKLISRGVKACVWAPANGEPGGDADVGGRAPFPMRDAESIRHRPDGWP